MMQFSIRMIMTLGLALLLRGELEAQPIGNYQGGPSGGLLKNKSVQTELKLTEEQIKKLDELAKRMSEKGRNLLFDLPRNTSREERMKMLEQIVEEHRRAIASVLSEKQFARHEQIRAQQLGFLAFSDKEIRKKLDMSEEQLKEILRLNDEFVEKRREFFRPPSDPKERTEQTRHLTKETWAKVNNVLNKKQRSLWKEMVGAPFELVREKRPRARLEIDPDKFFAFVDRNRDGKITKEEAGLAWELWSSGDKNKDGALTKDELKSVLGK